MSWGSISSISHFPQALVSPRFVSWHILKHHLPYHTLAWNQRVSLKKKLHLEESTESVKVNNLQTLQSNYDAMALLLHFVPMIWQLQCYFFVHI